jgi:hypothetical protein
MDVAELVSLIAQQQGRAIRLLEKVATSGWVPAGAVLAVKTL